MSHCRTSSLYDHLDHCFVVFKHMQQSFLTRRFDILVNKNQHFPNHRSLSEIACVCELCEVVNELHVRSLTSIPVLYDSDSCFQELQRSDPANQKREYRLTLILHPKKRFLMLLNCAICLLYIQLIGTNVWLPEMHNVPPDADFESSRSPAKSKSWSNPNVHCLMVLHMKILSLFTCMMNTWNQSIQAFVTDFGPFRYRPCKFNFLTTKHQVVQYVPNKSISEQFESMHLKIIQQISFLLLWSGGHRCME